MRDKQRTDEESSAQECISEAGLSLFVRATRPRKRELTRCLSSKAKTWSGLAVAGPFVLLRKDWAKGIAQVLESMVGEEQVGISGMVESGNIGR